MSFHFHIKHIHISVEVPFIQKNCRKNVCFSVHCRTVWGILPIRDFTGFTNPGKDQIGRRINRISKVNAFENNYQSVLICQTWCVWDNGRQPFQEFLGHSWAPGCDIICNRTEKATRIPASLNLRRMWTRTQWALELAGFPDRQNSCWCGFREFLRRNIHH